MSEDFNFNRIINYAEEIIGSGKFVGLNNLVLEVHGKMGKDNQWLSTVLSSLHYRNGLEYKKIKSALGRSGDNLADLAWHTRNLLELNVWVTYCCQSNENAHTFFGDAARDGHNVLTSFHKWSKATGAYPQDEHSYTEAIGRLEKAAQEQNVYNIDEPYQHVSHIAKIVGLEHHFATLNKALSKFVHPTAHSIIGTWNELAEQNLRTTFYGQASAMFVQNFNLLEEAIKKL